MGPLLRDPWTRAQIEAAVAPYVGRLTPAEIEFMRQELADMLEHDEEAARLLYAAHPRDVDESGEVGCDPVADSARGKAG